MATVTVYELNVWSVPEVSKHLVHSELNRDLIPTRVLLDEEKFLSVDDLMKRVEELVIAQDIPF